MKSLFENWRRYLKERRIDYDDDPWPAGIREKDDPWYIFPFGRATDAGQAAGAGIDYFHKVYPRAKHPKLGPKFKAAYSRMIKSIKPVVLSEIKKVYLDNFKDFRRLMKTAPKYKNEPLEVAKQKWDEISSEIVKQLSATPVLMLYDYIDKFTKEDIDSADALYRREDKSIYVNPFKMSKIASGKGISGNLKYSLIEEYIHRAQHVLEDLKMPTYSLVYSQAIKQGLMLPQEETGLDQKTYNYYASNPRELHAKLFQLKMLLRKHNPKAFDPDGRIDPRALAAAIKERGEEFRVLKVFNPKKINQLSKFFDTVAAVDSDVKQPSKGFA